MTREEAIKELKEDIELYIPLHETIDDVDRDLPDGRLITSLEMAIKALEQEPKTGHCKDCKHFEYDKVAKVDGIPLIVAHEICNKWGDGCKTKEDGYCFLFEPQESEE